MNLCTYRKQKVDCFDKTVFTLFKRGTLSSLVWQLVSADAFLPAVWLLGDPASRASFPSSLPFFVLPKEMGRARRETRAT